MEESGAKTILVVDDQVDERAIQRAMLGHLGFRVREAENGIEGLRAAIEDPPDLVLLDVAMPQMDGFTVCRELRSHPRTAKVPIVIFTASLSGEITSHAKESGADAVLIKPVEPQKVAEEVVRLLGDTGQPRAAGRG
jgi:CheY-like chemotaxis protein